MNKSSIAIFLSFAVLLFLGQSCTTPKDETSKVVDSPSEIPISSFEECVAAGNPVMESYPRQCRTQKGVLFAEELDTQILPPVDEPAPDTTVEQPVVEPVNTPPVNTEPQTLPESPDTPVVHVNTEAPPVDTSSDVVYDSADSSEPQDSMEVDIDGINWGDPVEDTTYEDTSYEDTSVDPNACSPEGAIDNSTGETYHCLDGIWTHELYVY